MWCPHVCARKITQQNWHWIAISYNKITYVEDTGNLLTGDNPISSLNRGPVPIGRKCFMQRNKRTSFVDRELLFTLIHSQSAQNQWNKNVNWLLWLGFSKLYSYFDSSVYSEFRSRASWVGSSNPWKILLNAWRLLGYKHLCCKFYELTCTAY